MVAMIANGWHLRQMGKSSSVQNVTLMNVMVNLMRLKNGPTSTQIVRKEKLCFGIFSKLLEPLSLALS